MRCSANVCQLTASNLSHIAMLELSMHRRPECTLTNLRIQEYGHDSGMDLPTTERRGVGEVLWLGCVPGELTPTGRTRAPRLSNV